MENSICPKIYNEHYNRLHHSIRKETSKYSIFKRILCQNADSSQQADVYRNITNGRFRSLKESSSMFNFWPHLQDVPCSKGRWFQSTNFRSEKTKRLFAPKKVLPPQSLHYPGIHSERGFYDKARSITGVLSCSSETNTPALPSGVLSERALLYDLPAIWPIHRSNRLHQNFKLYCESTTQKGYQGYSLPGRLPSGGSRCSSFKRKRETRSETSNKLRVESKPRQINNKTYSRLGVSRNRMEYENGQKVYSAEKDRLFKKKTRRTCKVNIMELAASEIYSWKLKLRSICSSSRPTSLSPTSNCQQNSSRKLAQSKVSDSSKSNSGHEMVAGQPPPAIGNLHPTSRSFPLHRRFRYRLGSSYLQPDSSRDVDKRSVVMAHQSEGTPSRMRNDKEVQTCPEEQNSIGSVRQSDRYCIHKESRWNEIPDPTIDGGRVASVSRELSHSDFDKIHSWNLQQCCGPLITTKSNPRLASIGSSHTQNFPKMGTSISRPICNKEVQSSDLLCQSVCTGPGGTIHRRIQPALEFRDSVGIPATDLGAQSIASPQLGDGNLHSHCTEVASGILVPRHPQKDPGTCSPNSGLGSSSYRHDDRTPPASSQPTLFAGLENTGWPRFTDGWGPGDVELLQNSWRPGTLRSYSAPWKRWTAWANSEAVPINTPSPEQVALFLSFLHNHKKLSYSTILVNKSVVTSFADPSRADLINDHPVVKHMLKAISISHAKEKRSSIWDVTKLMAWLKANPPDEKSIFQVSRHLAVLLLLASGRRIHDLTLLSINESHIQESENHIYFWPKFGSKTDSGSHRQSGWKISRCEDQSLDIVYWFKILINISANRRKAVHNLDSLFISTRGTVRAASRAVIAGWVKTALKEIGVDTSPGSIRSAVGSSRFSLEMPLDEILKKGNWTNDFNFLKFYCKNIERLPTDVKEQMSHFNSFEAI